MLGPFCFFDPAERALGALASLFGLLDSGSGAGAGAGAGSGFGPGGLAIGLGLGPLGFGPILDLTAPGFLSARLERMGGACP